MQAGQSGFPDLTFFGRLHVMAACHDSNNDKLLELAVNATRIS
jgi:hypothetical protein